jgi:hypothetical protein
LGGSRCCNVGWRNFLHVWGLHRACNLGWAISWDLHQRIRDSSTDWDAAIARLRSANSGDRGWSSHDWGFGVEQDCRWDAV